VNKNLPDAACTGYLTPAGEIDAQLFQSSFDCIKIIDLNGRLVLMNPGAINALELDHLEQLYGKEWGSLWPDESKGLIVTAVAQVKAGQRADFTAFCPTTQGSPRWWHVVASPILDAHGKVERIMAVSRDVSEVHLAREALRDADRRKDEFLAVLAHELRNPLSTAGMAASLLETQAPSGARAAELGSVIARQVSHMSRMVEDLIDISRVVRGLVSLERTPVSLRAVADSAIEQVQGMVSAKSHTLAFALPDGEHIVFGDHTRLVQAVANLLGNAARYTPEGGSIDVTLTREAEMVVLAVRDSGVGIAPEKIAGLFDLYTQVDRTSDRSSSGLGLGLTLVRTLVELHAGTVGAFSAGKGAGSTFTIKIPAHA
jgi:PAS domain S-box-containing protein